MRWSTDRQQLDLEHQGRVRRDRARVTLLAVCELGRDGQPAQAADLHAGDPLIPAGDHLAGPELEAEARVAIPRAVELLATGQRADIVHGDTLAGDGAGASAFFQILDFELSAHGANCPSFALPCQWVKRYQAYDSGASPVGGKMSS